MLKLARFIHIMLRKKNLKFLPKGEHFGIFGGSLKIQGITKKFHFYNLSPEKIARHCQELTGK